MGRVEEILHVLFFFYTAVNEVYTERIDMNKITLSEMVRTFGAALVVMALTINQSYFNAKVAALYILGVATYILGLFVNDDFEF